MNNLSYKPTVEEVIKIGLSLADGTLSYNDLVKWIGIVIDR